MQIKILKFTYSNIRDFHELEVPLTKNKDPLDPYHISLIQMPKKLQQ